MKHEEETAADDKEDEANDEDDEGDAGEDLLINYADGGGRGG